MPDRLLNQDSSQQFLSSLLNQNTSEDYRIVICYPNKLVNYPDDQCLVPDWFSEAVNNSGGKIILIRDDIDYGPITNILYPIKHIAMNAEDIIIVCDDDHQYHEDMVRYHAYKLSQYPSNHCICFRGNDPKEMRTWQIDNNKVGRLYNSCILFPTPIDKYLRFPDHWHSVSYRRSMLGEDMFNADFLSITWNNDILMGYYAWTHDLYFVCASYDKETDYRPVNHEGRGSNSFPIVRPLPFNGDSGCNRWRQKRTDDIWQNSIFSSAMNKEKGVIKL
ncbi:MAG: hypothetical protein WCJ62_09910 [Flavobacterium sp.]